jgi:hypothetical protein
MRADLACAYMSYPTHSIADPNQRYVKLQESTFDRSCGPSGCEIDWLSSRRLEVDDDPIAFAKLATEAGWGDGLPLIPPTEDRVRQFVAASGRFPDDLLGLLPPRDGRCTVEKLAVNAVMAGAPAEAMPLLCASIEACVDPALDLFSLNTTTSAVVPGIFVNGPVRHSLNIPMEAGCFGGVAGCAPAIGRALRLTMRNVGGQKIGENSKSVFGQPARVTGIVVAEWEERSPWAPLAERRGITGNAVTAYGCIGTMDIADVAADRGDVLVELIGKSLAYPGTNAYISHWGAETMVALAPPWADFIAADYPSIEETQQALWQAASHPIDFFPEPHRAWLESRGRVDAQGIAHLVERPEEILVMVCGGLGNLHAFGLHNFGPTRAVTRGFPALDDGETA